MEATRNVSMLRELRDEIKKFYDFEKYKVEIKGVKAGMTIKGMKIVADLYSEKDMKVRELKKQELKLILMGLDGMNYFHRGV